MLLFIYGGCMKIKVNKKFINITKVEGFINKFKCMKFVLDPITSGFCLVKKRRLSTYFFCQKIDVIMTDKDNNILYMYPNLNSEKRIHFKRRVFYTYILPLDSCKNFNIGDKLIIKEK